MFKLILRFFCCILMTVSAAGMLDVLFFGMHFTTGSIQTLINVFVLGNLGLLSIDVSKLLKRMDEDEW